MRSVRGNGLLVCTAGVVCSLAGAASGQVSNGPDVIVGELPNISNYTPNTTNDVGFDAFAVGTTSCNRGNANLQWYENDNRHPVIGQCLYRFHNGRFEQVGQGHLKHGYFALQGTECAGDAGFPHASCTNANAGGTLLGVGCSDPYDSGLNGSQSRLGPKWQVNATTGLFPYPFSNVAYSGQVARRLRVRTSDLASTGARWFVQGYYACGDDSFYVTSGVANRNNSASWREVSFSGGPTNYAMALATGSTTRREQPAIYAWQVADPGVVIAVQDVVNDGRWLVGARVTGPVSGVYTYEYAVQNLNSHRSGGSFSVPYPNGTSVSNIGFHDVEYHSGEPNAVNPNNPAIDDWTASAGATSVTWHGPAYNGTPPVYVATPAPELLLTSFTPGTGNDHWANALRWDTLFNFRFQTTVAPATGSVQVALWRPGGTGDPRTVSFAVPTPGGATTGAVNTGPCCNGTTCTLTTPAACTGSFGVIGTLCTPNPCIPFPTGACCVSGACTTTPETTCQGLWLGASTTCSPTACPSTGACCVAGECSITSNTSCGGTYLGNNTTCSGTPCATGACCNGTTCSILTSVECGTGGGSYQGNSTTCTPTNPCSVLGNDLCSGAVPLCDGVSQNGTTVGATTDGTASCATASFNDRWYTYTPTATGPISIAILSGGTLTDTVLSVFGTCGGTQLACDDDSGPGLLSLISNFNATAGTTYRIRVARWNTATDGTYIIRVTGGGGCAPTGACCVGSTCTSVTETSCNTSGGTWSSGVSCTPNPCGVQAACCDGTTCSLTTQAACTLTWVSTSGTCSPNPCIPSNDLCENRPGIGLGTTPFNSTFAGTDGIPHNPGCFFFNQAQIFNDLWFNYPASFTGSLRIDTCGSSFDTKIAVYSGYGCLNYDTRLIACDDDNPTVCGTGSLHSSVTINVTIGDTVTIRVGSFSSTASGAGVLNLTAFPVTTGACCDAGGGCSTTTQAACSGSYQGDGSSCSPNPCPQPTGACCAANGNCTTETQAACTGAYQGDGSSCMPNPCPQPQGACCNGAACSFGTQAQCTGAYQGDNTACGPAGNPTTCCPANFNQAGGLSVQDIFDFLAAYFANSLSADFNSSGGLSVQDIFDFLAAYFTGCPG